LFLLSDLLPLFLSEEKSVRPVDVKFTLPSEWRAASVEKEVAAMKFEVENIAHTVFAIGPDLRMKRERIGDMELDFVAAGEWMFADEDAFEMAAKILREHITVFRSAPQRKAMLYLSPFPRPFGAQRWSAETRGKTVVLLSGKMPTKLSALIQLSSPLTHELFHFWLPNGLALDGEYDWFYEGFTLYQALRAGMRLNYFTFQDYLDAIGRAYNAYQSEPKRDALSLPDASRHRWSGANALVYNKGMLVAFLYDLTLRQNSKGRRSLDDVFRELFVNHNSTKVRADGNKAVIEVLIRYEGMSEFVNRYVKEPGAIDLQTMLVPFGLILERETGRTRIRVSPKISRAQRALLKKFGYNDKQS
jgi:predicted metalloprotease with PDZ domain